MAKRIFARGIVHPMQGNWRLTETYWVNDGLVDYHLDVKKMEEDDDA